MLRATFNSKFKLILEVNKQKSIISTSMYLGIVLEERKNGGRWAKISTYLLPYILLFTSNFNSGRTWSLNF